MRQVARRLRDGSLEIVDVPEPQANPGSVAVRLQTSIISSGTERATLEVARSGLISKARARPEQARQAVERARAEGVRSTLALVRQRLEELGPLGYSAAGVAVEVGSGVSGISPGDKVAIAGGGFANHAEVDVVPALLCARVPESVSSDEAAFTTLGAIALNGFRRGEAGVGATVAVIGLGLIGQLAVRIARAAGCRVIGVDLDHDLCELARRASAEVAQREQLGDAVLWEGTADAVLVCASSKSSDPVELAAKLARDRAPVVVVGDVDMTIPRGPFYDKELDLRLARSYGPGRYDPSYELHGLDYPIGHVRWTEQRNMAAFLDLIASGSIRPAELITHRFRLDDAEEAFETVIAERPLAVALDYRQDTSSSAGEASRPGTPQSSGRSVATGQRRPRFGIIGAGSFATATLIPGLISAGLEPGVVASAAGLSAADAKRRFSFDVAVADAEEVISSEAIDLVVVATRHDSHATLATLALQAGHPVYVEKPLALSAGELRLLREAQLSSGAPLIVGFNRRHAPLARELRGLGHPRLMTYRVNAGRLPPSHWVNDLSWGGGRLLGEACHFVDFLCDQARSDPATVLASGFPSSADLPLAATDNFSVQIDFVDGSVGTLQYAADAPTGPGKERFELSAPGLYGMVDDFKTGRLWRGKKLYRLGGRRRDKGFKAQFAWLAEILRGEREPPDPESFYVSTLATLAAARSLETGGPVQVMVGTDQHHASSWELDGP